jgi:hypothetical protein
VNGELRQASSEPADRSSAGGRARRRQTRRRYFAPTQRMRTASPARNIQSSTLNRQVAR